MSSDKGNEVVVKAKVGLRIIKHNPDGKDEIVFERGWVEEGKYSEKGSDPTVSADAFVSLMNNFINCLNCGSGYQLTISGYAYDTNNNQYTLSNVSASFSLSNNTLTLTGSLTPSSSITIASLTWGAGISVAPQYTPYAPGGVICPVSTTETITGVNASLNANTTYTFILSIAISVPSSF